MQGRSGHAATGGDPVAVVNGNGLGPFVVLCDHASNRIPEAFGTLGLTPADVSAHIAWDPGALGVSLRLSERLDAPLVYPTVSRLVIDCNRDPSASDLIPEISESTTIPGNAKLSEVERAARIAAVHTPYHDAVTSLLDSRDAATMHSVLVAVHSFTPVYKGVARPWQVGLIADNDRRLFTPMIAALTSLPDLTVGDNQPYSAADGVYYTLTRHGEGRDLACIMIEIRNDQLASAAAEQAWGDRLADLLLSVLPAVT